MPTYKPHARVAHRTSRRIDVVDGVPTTHKQHGWVHAWTVTDSPKSAAPLPFAAKAPVPAVVAVPAMCALVLIVMAVALLVVFDGSPNRSRLIVVAFAAVGMWSVLLSIPALRRSQQ